MGYSQDPCNLLRTGEQCLKIQAKYRQKDDSKKANQEILMASRKGRETRIILDRLLPPRKDSPIKLDLPKIESSAELLKAIGCVTDAVGSGQITPSEGEALSRIIDIHSRALELTEFEQRLTVLEQRAGNESIK